jgi:hypothetical protein
MYSLMQPPTQQNVESFLEYNYITSTSNFSLPTLECVLRHTYSVRNSIHKGRPAKNKGSHYYLKGKKYIPNIINADLDLPPPNLLLVNILFLTFKTDMLNQLKVLSRG